MSKKRILAITGIRSEYDILYPILKRIQADSRFELKLVVSSAHLSSWHGETLYRIEQDGFEIVDKIDSLFMTNRNVQRVKGIGMLTYGLAQTVERENPDFLLVVGDREESIATALVGNYMNVLVAHLGGGDPVFGNTDDPIRMAVSKLAHIHFVTAKEYGNNLIEHLSEDEFRVVFSGNPALANIKDIPTKSLKEISNFLDFDITDGNYLVLIKHPLSSELSEAYSQMKITLQALETFCNQFNYKVVASYPNTDPGAYDVLKAIEEFEGKEFIKFNATIPREFFINLIRNTKALVGNSSMGILEAPFYKLPVVNVGNRQQGRLNAGNVEFVAHEKEEIIKACVKACFDEEYREQLKKIISPYGNGDTPEIITEVLKSINPQDEKWLVKKNLC